MAPMHRRLSIRRPRAAIVAATLALVVSLTALPGKAHHSVAMYDNDHLIELSGTVTRVEWTSPHVFVYFTTTGADGVAVEWSVELDPPVLLRRYGWRESTVEAGDAIKFTGAPALSGAPTMRGAIAELADGTELRVWSRV
jgi:Family of unknown function (DUF6152)